MEIKDTPQYRLGKLALNSAKRIDAILDEIEIIGRENKEIFALPGVIEAAVGCNVIASIAVNLLSPTKNIKWPN